MRNLFAVLSVLFTLLVATSAFSPSALASSGPTFTNGSIVVIFVDSVHGTEIQFSNMGTAPFIATGDPTEDERQICSQAFSVCVDGNLDVGASGETGVNLLPSKTGGSFLRPFYYGALGQVVFLTAVANTSPPRFNLSQVPSGKLIYLMEENAPTGGACLGVRTTFIWDRDGQTLCKTRKWFNTCTHNTRITAVKEYECICEPVSEGPGAGTSGKLSVTISEDDEDITFFAAGYGGWTPVGAKLPLNASKAGRVGICALDFDTGGIIAPCDMFTCSPGLIGSVGDCAELFMSFLPGGVVLKPVGKPGSEKFLTVCLHILNLGDGE